MQSKEQEEKHSNLSDGDEGLDIEGAGADIPVTDEDEEGGENEEERGEGEERTGEADPGGEDDECLRKRARMSRKSADATIAQVDMLLEPGRISHSRSHHSNSSHASSTVSISRLAVSDR